MEKTVYKRTDITNFFTIEKFAYFTQNKFDFKMPYPLERHDFFELQYMKCGARVSIVNGEKITVEEGQILLIPPDAPHMLTERSEDAVCYGVGFTVFRDRELLSLSQRAITLSVDEMKMLEDIFSESIDCLEELPMENPDKGFKTKVGVSRGQMQVIRNRFEIFFIRLIEAELTLANEDEENMRKISVPDAVHDFLRLHITDKISLTQISDALSLSISYICREFKKKHGCGVIDYFLDLKIEKAKQLMEETAMNFTQIAEYLSFESESHFSKTFSKRVGVSPGMYSKSIKNSKKSILSCKIMGGNAE